MILALMFATCVTIAAGALTVAVHQVQLWREHVAMQRRLKSYMRAQWTSTYPVRDDGNDPTWTREEMGLSSKR